MSAPSQLFFWSPHTEGGSQAQLTILAILFQETLSCVGPEEPDALPALFTWIDHTTCQKTRHGVIKAVMDFLRFTHEKPSTLSTDRCNSHTQAAVQCLHHMLQCGWRIRESQEENVFLSKACSTLIALASTPFSPTHPLLAVLECFMRFDIDWKKDGIESALPLRLLQASSLSQATCLLHAFQVAPLSFTTPAQTQHAFFDACASFVLVSSYKHTKDQPLQQVEEFGHALAAVLAVQGGPPLLHRVMQEFDWLQGAPPDREPHAFERAECLLRCFMMQSTKLSVEKTLTPSSPSKASPRVRV